jgi:lambda family phage minor tail protein L
MLTHDIQILEPGSEIILFEVDGSDFGADIMRFHAHNIPHAADEIAEAVAQQLDLPAKSIWWQGEEYSPWPVKIEDVEINSDGSPSSPKLTVANLEGTISALCLIYQNMENARVTIHRTLAKYLDAANFSDGNADADPTQENIDIWLIDQKTTENNQIIQFQLSNPAAVGNYKIGRKMTPYCFWCQRGRYRGPDCGYTGGAMFDIDDNPTTDPAADQCSGTIAGCKKRFGEDAELPYGGFAAVRMIK